MSEEWYEIKNDQKLFFLIASNFILERKCMDIKFYAHQSKIADSKNLNLCNDLYYNIHV